PFLRAMTRKPSCLISCSQSLPDGSLSVLAKYGWATVIATKRTGYVSYFTLGRGGYLLCWPNHRAIGDRPHGRFLLTWPCWLPPGGVFSICAAAVAGGWGKEGEDHAR